jgi:hypothetical protein
MYTKVPNITIEDMKVEYSSEKFPVLHGVTKNKGRGRVNLSVTEKIERAEAAERDIPEGAIPISRSIERNPILRRKNIGSFLKKHYFKPQKQLIASKDAVMARLDRIPVPPQAGAGEVNFDTTNVPIQKLRD